MFTIHETFDTQTSYILPLEKKKNANENNIEIFVVWSFESNV